MALTHWTRPDASPGWNLPDNWSSSALGEFPDRVDDNVSIPAIEDFTRIVLCGTGAMGYSTS